MSYTDLLGNPTESTCHPIASRNNNMLTDYAQHIGGKPMKRKATVTEKSNRVRPYIKITRAQAEEAFQKECERVDCEKKQVVKANKRRSSDYENSPPEKKGGGNQ